MKTLTGLFLGTALLLGTAFAAQESKDTTKPAPAPTTQSKKKHHKNKKKTDAAATTNATAPAASPKK